MLTEEQSKLIYEKAAVAKDCCEFAQKFLVLPSVTIDFDDCPSLRFPTMDNCAETGLDSDGNGRITINAPWFAERIIQHQDDVEFYIFHELRHVHQKYQVWLLSNGEETREPIETVRLWGAGLVSYTRNKGGKTQVQNVTQEVEIDANTYGILMEMLYRDGQEPNLSLPMEAFKPANERLEKYLDTLPEFAPYRAMFIKQTLNSGKPRLIVKGRKIGRNEPCPCGSGKKFKQCCIGKGIYD